MNDIRSPTQPPTLRIENHPLKSARNGKRPLVLVVERDPRLRELEAHFLGAAGYDVVFEVDGQAALAYARASLPDLIITEILVAKLDGLALCRQLKADEKTREISVLVFSILASSSRAKEAGADAFLLKPLSEQRLLGMVRDLLEERFPRAAEQRA
jgi:two-component system response regulator MprA